MCELARSSVLAAMMLRAAVLALILATMGAMAQKGDSRSYKLSGAVHIEQLDDEETMAFDIQTTPEQRECSGAA